MTSVRAVAQSNREASLSRLMDVLAIPSVSAVPEHAPDIARAADWVAAQLREVGAGGVRIDPTPGHPVVTGRIPAPPGRPTVLVYGHYDVQPAEPLDLWTTPPFEPTVREGYLYARGSSDDKGQFLAYIEALRAYKAAGTDLPVGVIFVIEGEEEVGSQHLEPWLEAHVGELAADVAMISDSAMAAPGQPTIVYGLRGLAYLELDVQGPVRDLHSGQYGGAVLNPARALAQILAGLHDDNGQVTIPGFYDSVRELTDSERAELAGVPYDVGAFQSATGQAGGWGEAGFSLVERLGARPTLDVNGVWGGWTGAGAKTVIPAKVHAKVSMRLVPDQDPHVVADLFTRHVQALAPAGCSVSVRALHAAWPVLVPRDTAAMHAAAQSAEAVYGRPPIYTREGGSIPVVASLKRILGLDTVLLGFGLPDDNLHAPDERFALDNYYQGIEAVIAFFDAFAGGSR